MKEINNTTFTEINLSKCTLYAPEESVEAYKTDIHWKIYADQIFPMPKKANE